MVTYMYLKAGRRQPLRLKLFELEFLSLILGKMVAVKYVNKWIKKEIYPMDKNENLQLDFKP